MGGGTLFYFSLHKILGVPGSLRPIVRCKIVRQMRTLLRNIRFFQVIPQTTFPYFRYLLGVILENQTLIFTIKHVKSLGKTPHLAKRSKKKILM